MRSIALVTHLIAAGKSPVSGPQAAGQGIQAVGVFPFAELTGKCCNLDRRLPSRIAASLLVASLRA